MRIELKKTAYNSIKPLFKATKVCSWRFLVFAIILVGISAYGVASVIAQPVTSQEYNIDTVRIYAGKVSSSGWQNVEQAGIQNLDDTALYQEFKQLNSAYIDPDKYGAYARQQSAGREDEDEESNDVDLIQTESEDALEVAVTASSTITSATTTLSSHETEVPEDVISPVTGATTSAQAVEEDKENSTDEDKQDSLLDVPETDAVKEDETSAQEAVPVDTIETEFESHDDTDTSLETESSFEELSIAHQVFSFTVATVRNLFPFSQATSSERLESEVMIEPTSSSSNAVEDESRLPVATSTVTSLATTSTTTSASEAIVLEPVTIAATSSEVAGSDSLPFDNATTTVATTSTSTVTEAPVRDDTTEADEDALATQADVPLVRQCGDDCTEYTLEFSDFGLPLFDENTFMGGGQFRLSFGAQKKHTRPATEFFEVEYGVGEEPGWLPAGNIIVDDETSNGYNGGYFLFSLPELNTADDLDTLRIRLVYKGDTRAFEGIFVESAWLEVFTVTAPDLALLTPDEASLFNGFDNELLSGDALVVPGREVIEFINTDENEDETLIIKSDKMTYEGLSEVTTYFNITNTSDKSDDVSLKTYFPKQVGEVVSLEQWNQNRPKEVVIPEYRPFVYHCEAGWEATEQPLSVSIQNLSSLLSPATDAKEETSVTEDATEQVTATTSPSSVEVTAEEMKEEDVVITNEVEVEGEVESVNVEEDAVNEEVLPAVVESASTTDSAASSSLQSSTFTSYPFAQATASSLWSATSTEAAVNNSATSTETNAAPRYECRNTSIVRACDTVTGDNTACQQERVRVQEHVVEQFTPGWEKVTTEAEAPEHSRSLLRRAATFVGFGVPEKDVPERFEARSYTPEKITIAPGETKYFKMTLSFPPFTSGEYWVEAVGDKEYGLLDPFWNSAWQYKKELVIDNPLGTSRTEQQVYFRLDSSDIDFWTNVKPDGGDIRFVREVPGTEDQWYGLSWSNRLPFTIQAAEVDATLTDFPVYVDLSTLGDDFFSGVNNDGGDIRITNSDGVTEMPYEIVSIDTGAKTGELHFKADSISSSVDTTFYIYYKNASASGYSIDDPFGAENVWTEYTAVYHLPESGSSYADSTANDNDGVGEVTDPSLTTGQLGDGQDFSGNGRIDLGNSINGDLITAGEYYVSTWLNLDSSAADQSPVSQYQAVGDFLFWADAGGGGNGFCHYNGSYLPNDCQNLNNQNVGSWQYVVAHNDGSDAGIYLDGVETGNGPTSNTFGIDPTLPFSIGTSDGNDLDRPFNGQIDEVRIAPTSFGEEWAAAEFSNQSTPTTFYATSTAESVAFTTFVELDHWIQHFDNVNDDMDVWVQIDTLPAAATSSIYMYYGNSSAESTSDQYEPFTYSTITDLYYVTNADDSSAIVVYSLIDGNEVSIDGGAAVALDQGETTSFSTYTEDSVISALGPITSRTTDNSSEAVVPISFASTTFAIPSDRGNENYHVYAPFSTASVDVYEGADVTPAQSSSVTVDTSFEFTSANTNNEAGVIESDQPVLVYHNNGNDSIVAYPPTMYDLFGVHSQNYQYTLLGDGTEDIDIACSSGAGGSNTGIGYATEESNDYCSSGGYGAGDGVRLYNQTAPLAAIQQADGDGNESSVFLPEPEFGTHYYLPQAAEYVSVVCSPRFGSVSIEVQNSLGSVISSGTCSPSGSDPDVVNFTPGSAYPQGYQVVATNDVPFYIYYQDAGTDDETNTWSAVQGKSYGALDFGVTVGAQEANSQGIFIQHAYRWYENEDNLTPSTPWQTETGDIMEGEKIEGQAALNPGDDVRLRMSLEVTNGTSSAATELFQLQYAESLSCESILDSSWTPVTDVGSTTVAFTGNTNASVSDGETLSTLVLSDSDVAASYEDGNNTVANFNEFGSGSYVEFDWSIMTVAPVANSNYCFRMVAANGDAFNEYTDYPEVATAGPPETPRLLKRFNNEYATSTTPLLSFVSVDLGGDEIDYQVQVSTDEVFGSTVIDRNSGSNPFDFENLSNASDKSPFTNGQVVGFTAPTSLSNGQTYWWRVRAIDTNGSNTYTAWSAPFSFTIDTAGALTRWHQTTDAQFTKNSFSNATTSGSGSVKSNLGGSTVLGEYGTVSMTNGVSTTVTYANTYTNPVVVASIRYARSVANGDQPAARVIEKTTSDFTVLTDNYTFNAPGTSVVDYVVMEAGEYLMDDGEDGLQVFATSTSVSTIAGSSIPTNPGGPVITYPTSFSSAPAVLAAVTSNNDPQWVVASVYDGNDVTNTPTATEIGLYLNDNIASDGHTAAEDIDIIVFDLGNGTNDGVGFDILTTGAVVSDTPYTQSFGYPFSAAPEVTAVTQLTMNGAQGSYSMVDVDTPATATNVTIAAEEGGTTGARSHATEDMAIVAFADASGTILRAGTSRMVSTPIDFDDVEVGNAWGQIDATDTGDVTYTVQYQTGDGFQAIPDADLPGNAAGFSSTPINILNLNTVTYNEIRLVADLGGVNPTISDWTVSWGLRVSTPELGDPFDNQKTSDTTPVFDFFSTDPQGDDLAYELSYSTDSTFITSSTTIYSDSDDTDFSGSSPYTSGDAVTYTVPNGSELADGETYWWRIRAKDPGGSDAFSPWTKPDSFTVDTSVTVSTWFQTTQAQFREGEIDGVVASTTNSVELTSEVAEFGEVVLSGNEWTTITTELSYQSMVVVASPEYSFNGVDNGRTIQVRNKTANSFEIRAENDSESLAGSTQANYFVIEQGDWVIGDGGSGMRMIAGTVADVANIESASYDGTGGTTVVFSPAFSAAPEAILTVTSDNNGATWTGTAVSSGGSAGSEIGTASMDVSLGLSRDTDTVRSPEDVDYVVFETGAGTNSSILFDALRGTGVTHSDSSVSFNQSFSTIPQVILVHNNANSGADGAFAQQDTDIAATANDVNLSVAEMGSGAGTHTGEAISVLAFETASGTVIRDGSIGGGLTGTIASEEVLFSDGVGPKFDRALYSATTPGNSTTTVQVQYQTATSSWALIPDAQVSNNSIGNTSGTIDLTGVDIVEYPVIRLLATLACDANNCPTLDDWTVEWSEGVAMSGTLEQLDRTTAVANATVTVSINGAAPVRTGTVTGGVWSIENVTAFDGDVLTVFVSDVPDDEEAVGVFVYDGLGDMTGVELFQGYLSLSADETATTTIADLALGDNGAIGDEDVFFDVSASGNLSVCAVNGCDMASLYIGPGNTFVPATSTDRTVYTHDFINDGHVELDTNTMVVSGSWYDNASVSADTSHVVFVGNEGGWYDNDWTRRVPVTIAASEVSDTLTDFPVYVQLADLPADFFTDVKSDGSDIRVTTGDGLTELPYELVAINTGAQTGELHFKAQSLSGVADNTFYIYYGNAAASAYGVTDIYGRNNVWTDYEAVWHFTDTNFVDSTGNPRTPTNTGVTATTIGTRPAINFNGSSYLDFGDEIDMGLGDLSMSVYVQTTDSSASYVSKSFYSGEDGRYALIYSTNLISLYDAAAGNANTAYGGAFRDSTFRQAAVTYDRDASNSLYADGVLRDSVGIAAYSGFNMDKDNHFFVGTYNDVAGDGTQPLLNYTGKMTELKVSRNVLSADWLATEYSNQVDPDAFYTIGTSTGSTDTAAASFEYLSGPLNFYDLSFSDATGGTVWETENNVVVNNDLTVLHGTLNRSTSTIGIKGNLLTGAGGFWDGVATTTFNGSGSGLWSDSNAELQNIGTVIIDGAPRSVVVTSDVRANSITIGANDTLNAGGSNNVYISGNFTNNNTFLPQSSQLVIDGTAVNALVTTGGSNLYSLRASTTAGSVSFAESTVTLLDNFEIATGTVTLPATELRVGGSFLNEGGSFAHNNASVRFTGSGAESVSLLGDPFLNALYDVTFAGTGDYSFGDTHATTTNTFTISAGDVTLPSGTFTVGRDFDVTGSGSFAANNGEVIFQVQAGDAVTTNGSSFYDVRFRKVGSLRSGTYSSSWQYRESVVVQSSQVDDDLTNFPVYVDLADFGSSFFTGIKSDAGDIRVTFASSSGEVEVPREVVSASVLNETGELYFLAPELSSSTNTTFYVYYGNSSASNYADTDTYGAHNVWSSDFEAVYHLGETGTTYFDSTANNNDGTGELADPTAVTGKVGMAQDFGGNGRIDIGNGINGSLIAANEYYISTWVNLDTSSGDQAMVAQYSGSGDFLFWADANDGGQGFCHYNGDYMPGNCRDLDNQEVGVWQHVAAYHDGSVGGIYLDSVDTGSGPFTSGLSIDASIPFAIGSESGSSASRELNGQIDEVRIMSRNPSAAWVAAEHRNQATTTDFYTATQNGVTLGNRTFTEATTDIDNNLIIEPDATVQFPSSLLTVGGSLDNNGIFTASVGTVRFDGASSANTIAAGISTFATLAINGTGDWTVSEHATATVGIALSDVGLFTVSPAITLESEGTFFNNTAVASTSWVGSTLRLSSGIGQTIGGKTAGADYGELQVTGAAAVKMWNSTASTYTTDPAAAVYSQDHAEVDGDLYIFGNYTRSAGTEYWSYATDFDGTDLSGGSERVVNVRPANGAVVTIATSSLELLGGNGATTTLDAQSGSFELTVANATVTAQYASFTGTDASGLALTSSTTIASWSDVLFTIPVASSAMTIDASTIDTNPAAQYFRTNFVSGGGNVNATLSGSPTSFWWFRNGQGDRYGEAFDNADVNPGSIRWDDSSYSITIAGTIFADDGTSPLGGPVCDGSTQNVRIVVDGGTYTDTTSCSGIDGSYSFSGVSYTGDPQLVVYLDTDGGLQGSVITITPTADVLDLDLYANRVMTRHEGVQPLTVADMATYDETDDSDLRFLATTGTPDTLTVRPDMGLVVASSTTFMPNGNITLQSGGSGNAYDGTLHLDNEATFIASSTEQYSIGGSFLNDMGSSFDAASSTLTFTATTTGKGITNDDGLTLQLHELLFSGVGGGWNQAADISVASDVTVANGTLTGTGDLTLETGSLTGNGTVSYGGGTVLIASSTTLGGTEAWTFYDLTLGDSATLGTTTRSNNATTTILNQLTISAGHTLDANSSQWELAGSGNTFVETGELLEDASTFTYSGGAGANVLSTNYYNLTIAGSAGTPTFTAGSSGFQVLQDMTVAGVVPTIFDLNTADPTIAIAGDIVIGANGTLSQSASNPLLVAGSFANNGALMANGGELRFTSADAYTVAGGDGTFGEVTLLGAGLGTFTEHATTTGDITIASTSQLTLQSGQSLAVGGALLVDTDSTTWTGSTLHLFGGSAYEVNDKSVTLILADVRVSSGTQVKVWNTDVSSVVTTSGGSLYSQDHASTDGSVYVYGDYVASLYDDHWSYATDFDGTDLSGGGERAVAVEFASDATARWVDGSLSVVGDAAASTTVSHQVSGTYGITVGGDAATTWQYATVRDIDSDGLTFTGSMDLAGFSDIDLLVEQNSGTAMTVGGTAITASPARTLTNIIFNSDTGVTGAHNVTATGTTLSGWRFTSHSGNLDGETNDVDPAGDPGYVIWDDSAAIISISGHVYEADRSSVSSVCDDTTPNIVLAIAGSIAQNASSSCSSADGSYTISGISFGSLDVLTLYIDGGSATGVTISKDPISSIADMVIYENHVVVRHENTNPMTINDLAVWDSSDDADIPFTASTGGTDTLSVPSDHALVVWSNKEFAPAGDVTLLGGGAGASYDGLLEALAGSTVTFASGEAHSVGGSFVMSATADFISGDANVTLTSDAAGRTIAVNEDAFSGLTIDGTGSYGVSDTNVTIEDDLIITNGTLTLPTGTTTVGGSLTNNDSFVANNGVLALTASGAETVTLGGNDAATLYFNGLGSWTMTDVHATTTNDFTVATGTVTLPSGTLAVGGDVRVLDTVAPNGGTIVLTGAAGTSFVTLSGNDVSSILKIGANDAVMTDTSATLLGDLTVGNGSFAVATNTLSIGGSLDATTGTLHTASGTLHFISSDTGEVVRPGTNTLYNVIFANASGGWTLESATTTNNFILTSAQSFTLNNGATLRVEGVFTNNVGGAATTFTNTNIVLANNSTYVINNKTTAAEVYDTLSIGADSDIRVWNSSAAMMNVATSSSLYSQDHAGADGQVHIYGDFTIGTSTEHWSYATDFDGVALGGSARAVSVLHATSASTTVFANGTLRMVGESGSETTVAALSTDTYNFVVDGGTVNFSYYDLNDMGSEGLKVSGTPNIISLSNGTYTLTSNGGSLMTMDRTALDANPSLLVLNTAWQTAAPAAIGTNINLSATSTNSWTFRTISGDIAGESYDIDGITNCGSLRWDDSSCLLVEQTEYRWRHDDGGIGVPNSEWFDTDWSKRQRARVVNDDNTTYSNAVVPLTVAYDTDMQTDFDDLRFTAENGVTELDYWTERVQAGVSAEVWVEVPSLAANDTAQLFMYYGNALATSQSSSTATLPVVDSFEDGDIAEYSNQTSLFSVDTNFNYGGTFGLELGAGNKGTRLNPGIARFDQTVEQGQTISFRQYVDTTTGFADEVCTMFAVQSPATNNDNYAVCLEQFGTDRISLVRDARSTDNYGPSVSVIASSTVTYTTGWYKVEVDWATDDSFAVRLYNPSDSLVASFSASDSTYTSGGYGFTSWGQNGGWDSFTARPLQTTMSQVLFGAEQQRNGASYAAPINTPSSAFTVGDVARLRVAVENTGLDITDQEFQLEYAAKGVAPSCASVSDGSYTSVAPAASCGADALCMATSTTVANGVATTDLLAVDANQFTAGSFVEDPANKTGAIDVDQNYYTELEYALAVTVFANDQSYCLRLSDDGAAYDSYVNVPELTLKFDPVIGSVSFNGGQDIVLNIGTTTRVYATTTVTDLNGYTDLLAASSTMYDSAVGAGCSANTNSCYVETTDSQCSFVGCSGASCTLSCYADYIYHANPTDESGGDWYAFLEVIDSAGGYDFATSPAIDLLTLRAFNVTNSIDYGALAPQSNTGATNATTTVENLGNDSIDILVSGTDLSDGFSSTIPVAQQKLATSSFNYPACVTCAQLSTTTVPVEVDLNKPTAIIPPVRDDIYWGIEIPFGVNSAPHTGTNDFYATDD